FGRACRTVLQSVHEPFPERPALLFDLVFPSRSERLLLNLGIADAPGLTPMFCWLGNPKNAVPSPRDPSLHASRAYRIPTAAALEAVVMGRHWRPSSWANRESSRTIVAECSACQTWIIVKRQFSIASARQLRAESTSTPSTSSSPGTAPSLGWPSTASSSCAIACTWNRGISLPTPSTSSSQPCVAWLTKPPTLAC